LNTEYVTAAEVLHDAGYRTGHFGKWHLGAEPYSPLQQGFDVDLPHTPGPGPGGATGYFAPWAFWKNKGKPGQHIEDRMAEEAVKFMRESKDQPFFLNYWAFSVHSPWMSKVDYADEAALRVDPKSGQRNPMYAGMVRSLDDAVGRITAALEELKLADNTIIIFTSDNGGWHNAPEKAPKNPAYAKIPATSNAPFRSGKASIYEGGTHVPLIVSWPGKVEAASTSDAIVQSTDFFPTLMELTKLSAPASVKFDGISIAPALRGEPLKREKIFCHFPHGGNQSEIEGFLPSTSVRRGDWKLIRFFARNDDGSDKLELYNLRDDIGETKNLAASKPELVTELNTSITTYLHETEAVVPIRNPSYKPDAASKPKAPADPLQGWKVRGCSATAEKGILSVTKLSQSAFLGIAAGEHSGASTVKLRIKSAAGAARIDWLPGGVQAKAQSTPYTLPGGDWQDLTVNLPATGPLGIVRVYLPLQEQPIVIDWIEIGSATGGKATRTEF
jgi:arylsulfatase A-like enzyme